MSGSDLAPFVAAVLNDSTMDEMKNEIDKLRSTLIEYVDETLLVQITGKNGTPVHYETSFKNAEPIFHEGEIDDNEIIGLRFTGQKSSNANDAMIMMPLVLFCL